MKNHSRRLGVLVPPSNVSVEREFGAFAPADVGIHYNRLSKPLLAPDGAYASDSLLSMLQSVERAAGDLALCHPEAILFACTSASFLGASAQGDDLTERIARCSGVRAATTSRAVVAAAKALGIRTCFMLTPYPDPINRVEAEFLCSHGVTVASWDTFNCANTEETLSITTEEVAARVLKSRTALKSCDGVFISCTNLLTMECITQLEDELGVPVISSNQATLWAGLRLLGLDACCPKAGSLFAADLPFLPGMP